MNRKSLLLSFAALITCGNAEAQWNTTTGAVNISNVSSLLSGVIAVPTTEGKTFVSWTKETYDGFKLYLQLLDKDGIQLFGEEGLLVDDNQSPSWRSKYGLVVTSDGSAVLSFADARSEDSEAEYKYNFEPVIYKVSQDKSMPWGKDGLTFGITDAPYTRLFVNGERLYYQFTHTDYPYGINFNRLNADGTKAWENDQNEAGKLVKSVGEDHIRINLASEGIVAQRYTEDTVAVWSAPAIIDSRGQASNGLDPYQVAEDGKGGIVVAYDRPLDFKHMSTLNYISADGEQQFVDGPIDAYVPEEGDNDYCRVAFNKETENILVTWIHSADGDYSLRATLITPEGNRLWGDKGIALDEKQSESGYCYDNFAIKPTGENYIVFYTDVTGWAKSTLKAKCIDEKGNVLWTTDLTEPCGIAVSDFATVYGDNYTYFFYGDDDEGIKGVRIFDDGTFDGKGTTSISLPETNNANGKGQYYNVNGVKIDAPVKGLNIERKADGTVRKFVVM